MARGPGPRCEAAGLRPCDPKARQVRLAGFFFARAAAPCIVHGAGNQPRPAASHAHAHAHAHHACQWQREAAWVHRGSKKQSGRCVMDVQRFWIAWQPRRSGPGLSGGGPAERPLHAGRCHVRRQPVWRCTVSRPFGHPPDVHCGCDGLPSWIGGCARRGQQATTMCTFGAGWRGQSAAGSKKPLVRQAGKGLGMGRLTRQGRAF